jgi:MSHA biogenesis protein MshL
VVEDDIKNFTLNGQAQSYPLAKSSVRESDSMVKAKNGEMVIIGGLMQDQTTDLKEGIPVLKDLPLLGHLFRHTVQTTKKSELVILLRPIIVENNTWVEQLNQTSDHFQRLDDEVKKDERKYHCKGPNC